MDSTTSAVAEFLVLICSLILALHGAPNPSDGEVILGEKEGENRVSSDVLTVNKSFYQEFAKGVDPSAQSRFIKHVGDMAFIAKEAYSNRARRNAVLYREFLWPNGQVPYVIAPSYDAFDKRIILKAMAHWEEHTCIRFYPKRSSDVYFIYINNSEPFDCSSFVGRIVFNPPMKQLLSLGERCLGFSTAVHELGHAIGLYHEHNRDDRDDYITVRPSLISTDLRSQYEKLSTSNTLGKGYDYASIMHYDSRRGEITSQIDAPFGGAEELSPLDIAKVNLLYSCGNCSNRPPLSTVVPSLEAPSGPCGYVIRTDKSGIFNFPSFSPNTKCNLVIAAPEGYTTEYYIQLPGGSNLDSSSNCDNSYISFYDGATISSQRLYRYSPRPRFCKRNEFSFTFILPKNVTTVSYQAGGSAPQPVRVNYYVNDVDECASARNCKACVNTVGSYNCTCNPGFYLSYSARTCFDINECACGNGGCEHNCTNTAGSYTCSCGSGYYIQADGKSCGSKRPSATPWKLVPGSLDTKSCPLSFEVPNQHSAVTTPKPTTVTPATVPPTTEAPVATPSLPATTPTEETADINVIVSSTFNSYTNKFSTPGWPNQPYPLNKNLEWQLVCPDGTNYIDIKFEESFLVAGKMPNCPKDKVFVYSNGIQVGGPYCHTTAPQPLQSLSATNTKVTFTSGSQRGTTRTGFGVRFQCRGSPPTTEKPTTPQPTLPPTTTMAPTTPRPTTSPPTTSPPTTSPPTTRRPITASHTTMMAATQSQTTSLPVSAGPCGPEDITATTRNNFNTFFSTPGWPNEPYPLNIDCEWRLRCPSSTDLIDIQFEENFKIAGKMPSCPKDYVYVYSKESKVGGPFCHLTAPENINSLDADGVRVTFHSRGARGKTRIGFAAHFRCRATISSTTLPPATTVQPTTPLITSSRISTSRPTTLQTTASPTSSPSEPTTHRPTTTIAPTQSIPTTSSAACGNVILASTTNVYYTFSTPGWPTEPYPLNIVCEWLLFCPSSATFIDIRFNDNFKVAGKMPNCPKDKLYVESNDNRQGPFCHTTSPAPISGLDATSTKVTFISGSGRGVTRTGFSVQFQCR